MKKLDDDTLFFSSILSFNPEVKKVDSPVFVDDSGNAISCRSVSLSIQDFTSVEDLDMSSVYDAAARVLVEAGMSHFYCSELRIISGGGSINPETFEFVVDENKKPSASIIVRGSFS